MGLPSNALDYDDRLVRETPMCPPSPPTTTPTVVGGAARGGPAASSSSGPPHLSALEQGDPGFVYAQSTGKEIDAPEERRRVPLGNTCMNLFFVCNAKTHTESCGVYLLGKLWRREGQNMWCCGIDHKGWAAHTKHPFSAVTHVGCGARFRIIRAAKGWSARSGPTAASTPSWRTYFLRSWTKRSRRHRLRGWLPAS